MRAFVCCATCTAFARLLRTFYEGGARLMLAWDNWLEESLVQNGSGALIDIGRTSFEMLSKIETWSFGHLRSRYFVEMNVEEVAETFGWRRCLKRHVGRWYNDDNVEGGSYSTTRGEVEMHVSISRQVNLERRGRRTCLKFSVGGLC
ncbi:MAG: hypothetical protein ACTS46_00360 [Candidatus Hodgkinia cicadicola]